MIKKIWLAVSDLKRHIDPLDGNIWLDDALPPEEIAAEAASDHGPVTTPWNEYRLSASQAAATDRTERRQIERSYHIRRIAWFVKNGVPANDNHPVSMTIKNDKLFVYEGRHRLAAAVLRNDEYIQVEIDAAGAEIENLLPDSRPAAETPDTPRPVPF